MVTQRLYHRKVFFFFEAVMLWNDHNRPCLMEAKIIGLLEKPTSL